MFVKTFHPCINLEIMGILLYSRNGFCIEFTFRVVVAATAHADLRE